MPCVSVPCLPTILVFVVLYHFRPPPVSSFLCYVSQFYIFVLGSSHHLFVQISSLVLSSSLFIFFLIYPISLYCSFLIDNSQSSLIHFLLSILSLLPLSHSYISVINITSAVLLVFSVS